MTETKSELLPCPFCGGKYIEGHPKMCRTMPGTSVPKLEELTEGGWRVTCYGCGIGTWDNLRYTKEQAITAWNTRAKLNYADRFYPARLAKGNWYVCDRKHGK